MSGGSPDEVTDSEASDSDDDTSSQMSGGPLRRRGEDEPRLRPGGGRVTFRFDLEEDLYWLWRQLEADWQRLSRPGCFLRFMCDAMWETWTPALEQDIPWKGTFERDRWQCQSPVCTSRKNLNAHHLEYRSRGGGDEDANLLCLCAECHLFGVHEGRIRVSPPAEAPEWVLGRDGWLVVIGRTKIQSPRS